MNDQHVRDFLERMSTEEPLPFLDPEPLARRARRRAARTVFVGAVGIAAAIAVLFISVPQLREASPNVPAIDPTPSGPILRRAGEILWFPRDGDLLAVDPVTGEERVLAEAIILGDAKWSANGRWAAFIVETESTSKSLWVVDAEMEPRKVADIPSESGRGSWDWSSTGALLAVHQHSQGSTATRLLHIIDPVTGLVSDLGSTAGIDSTFAWSPDDSRIVFGVGPRSIRSVDVLTGETSPVVELPGYVEGFSAFSWSPDGSHLAVLGDDQLLVMDADGSNIRIVAEREFRFTRELIPDWSPDSSRIVFATEHWNKGDGEFRIWVAPADGATASLIASSENCPGSYSYELWGDPVWSPDGSQIAFSWEPGCAHVVSADGSSDIEPLDDLTYASWSGGSFCSACFSWPIDEPLRYTGPSET